MERGPGGCRDRGQGTATKNLESPSHILSDSVNDGLEHKSRIDALHAVPSPREDAQTLQPYSFLYENINKMRDHDTDSDSYSAS